MEKARQQQSTEVAMPDEKHHTISSLEDGSQQQEDHEQEPEHQSPPSTSPHDYPEGGRAAWTVVFGAWCALFCTFGLVTCVGVFLDYYKRGPLAGYSPSAISWITSVQVFIQVGCSAVFGRLFDSYGPRWMLLIGTPVYCFGLMMLSLSTQYYQIFLAQAIVCSLGSGAIFCAGMTATTSWFLKRRGLVFGIVNSGSSLGGVVLPIMLTRLFYTPTSTIPPPGSITPINGQGLGFPWTIRILAFIFLALCAIACATIRTRLPPTPRPWRLADYTSPFREPIFVMTVIAGFLFFWGMFLPLSYIILQAQANGIPSALVPYLLPIVNGVSLIGRITGGMLADKFGRYNCMIIITGLTGILTLAVWIPGSTSTAGVVVYAIIFGFGSGGYVTLFPACMAQISLQSEMGTRSGVAQLANALGALTGSPLGGALIRPGGAVAGGASTTSFMGLQLFCGLTMVASAVMFTAARSRLEGWKMTKV